MQLGFVSTHRKRLLACAVLVIWIAPVFLCVAHALHAAETAASLSLETGPSESRESHEESGGHKDRHSHDSSHLLDELCNPGYALTPSLFALTLLSVALSFPAVSHGPTSNQLDVPQPIPIASPLA